MRAKVHDGSSSFELLIGAKTQPTGRRLHFHSVDELAKFLDALYVDPANHAELNSLRKSLLSESGDTRVRSSDQKVEWVRRFAQAFSRTGGVVLDVTPKTAGRGSGGAPAPVPEKPPPRPAPSLQAAPGRKPLTEFKVLEVTFVSAHAKLKDHRADWKNEGRRFATPEWRPGASHPVTHTKYSTVHLRLKILAGPADADPDYGELCGHGPLDYRGERSSISPGENVLLVKSKEMLGDCLEKRTHEVTWQLKLEKSGTLTGGRTGPHVLYCTYDVPRDDEAPGRMEDGVTLKRTDKAMECLEPIDSTVPIKIVQQLMSRFPTYSIRDQPDLDPALDHPAYRNYLGGAWPMLELNKGGECQAIVRVVMGILRQLGVPGQGRTLLVYADPKTPRKADFHVLGEGKGSGLSATEKTVDGEIWEAALTDKPVYAGEFYPPHQSTKSDGKLSPGFNSYEATMEFSEGGMTRYYAGGAGEKESIEGALGVFFCLVWKIDCEDPLFGAGIRVMEIIARYREA